MTVAFLQASLDGRHQAAEEILGATLPANWPDNPDVLTLRLQQLQSDPSLQPWLLRAICHLEGHHVIGHIGFHSAPAPDYLKEWLPGAVEFGFAVFSKYRRQGYASEAAAAVIKWAYREHSTTKFVLTIAPDNTPSRRIAARLGFIHIGVHEDPVDGTEDVFALQYDGPGR